MSMAYGILKKIESSLYTLPKKKRMKWRSLWTLIFLLVCPDHLLQSALSLLVNAIQRKTLISWTVPHLYWHPTAAQMGMCRMHTCWWVHRHVYTCNCMSICLCTHVYVVWVHRYNFKWCYWCTLCIPTHAFTHIPNVAHCNPHIYTHATCICAFL